MIQYKHVEYWHKNNDFQNVKIKEIHNEVITHRCMTSLAKQLVVVKWSRSECPRICWKSQGLTQISAIMNIDLLHTNMPQIETKSSSNYGSDHCDFVLWAYFTKRMWYNMISMYCRKRPTSPVNSSCGMLLSHFLVGLFRIWLDKCQKKSITKWTCCTGLSGIASLQLIISSCKNHIFPIYKDMILLILILATTFVQHKLAMCNNLDCQNCCWKWLPWWSGPVFYLLT